MSRARVIPAISATRSTLPQLVAMGDRQQRLSGAVTVRPSLRPWDDDTGRVSKQPPTRRCAPSRSSPRVSGCLHLLFGIQKRSMKGLHIGEFEELVLLAVQRLGDDACGVSIKQLLERETTRDVSIGAVYASLDRLEEKSFVRSEMTRGTSVRGGRSRRSFLASPEGVRALKEMRRVRDRLWRVAPARAVKGRS